MSLNVTIPDTFNGPLDLLLHLIRRDEMDIYDIPISRLTASYLEEMEKLPAIDVDEGAEFLDLASRLLEIKSRMLIPPDERETAEDDGEEEDFDPRSGLVEALLEYRRFKDAAKMLGDMAEEQSRRYPRVAPKMEFSLAGQAESPTAGPNDLMRAFQNLLDRMLPELSDAPDVITYTEVSIATRAEQIAENLLAVERTRFSRLLSDAPSKSEMVGLFIAMLELVRQGKILARQTDNFSDIIIERRVAQTKTPLQSTKWTFLPPGTLFFVLMRIRKRVSVKNSATISSFFPSLPPVSRRARRGGAARAAAARGLFPAVFSAAGKQTRIHRKSAQ